VGIARGSYDSAIRAFSLVLVGVVALVFAACSADTDPATDVTYKSAVLRGTLSWTAGEGPGEVWVEYRTGGGDWHETARTDWPAMGSSGTVETERRLTGLHPNTRYEFRVCGTMGGQAACFDSHGNAGGTAYDAFTTEDFPTVGVMQAKVFRDSVGVNTKSAFLGTPAGDNEKTKAALQYTGIRRIRAGLNWFPNGNGGYDNQRALFLDLLPTGVRGSLLYNCITDEPTIPAMLDAITRDGIAPFAAMWENPNEINIQTESCSTNDYAAQGRLYAQRFHDELSSRGLDNRPILGPSCGITACEAQLGDLSSWVTAGNTHPYRATGIPETAVEETCDEAIQYVPGGDCYITEFGWQLGPSAGGSERVQAAYTLRAFLDYRQKGVPTSFVHQLVDLNANDGDFGLYRFDWSPRLVADAIARMNATVGDGLPAPVPLAIRVDSGPPDLRWWGMRNSHGDYVVPLWRQAPAPGPDAQVMLTLPGAAAVEVVRPLDSGTAVPLAMDDDEVTVSVSPEPAFLVVRPR
jgi:hypothetical protein